MMVFYRFRAMVLYLICNILLALLIGVSWFLAGSWLGSWGEAFWLLLPCWVIGGGRVLPILPFPRIFLRSPAKLLGVAALLILIPVCAHLFLVYIVGGRLILREVLISIYFFAVSLELLLLYALRALDVLRELLSRGKGRRARLAITISVKALFYILVIPFLLATFGLHRPKYAPRHPEPTLRYAEVSFPSRSPRPLRLRGWFFPLRESSGTVIACHGVGANRADPLPIIRELLHAGFQVLAFDFRAHGESEGHTVSYGLREREDILGAWDYLLSRRDVDPQRIFGLGISMGAATLLMALPDLPDMRAAVADSAYSDLETMVLYQYRYFPGPVARALAWMTDLFGGLQTGFRVRHVSPLKEIERVRLPIFFIHGSQDSVVPPGCSEKLYRAYGGMKKLHIQDGADHIQSILADPILYRKEVRAFFLEAVGKR